MKKKQKTSFEVQDLSLPEGGVWGVGDLSFLELPPLGSSLAIAT